MFPHRPPLVTRREGTCCRYAAAATRKRGKTVSLERLMMGRWLNEAEHGVQPRLSFVAIVGSALILTIVAIVMWQWSDLPDRLPMAPRTVPLRAEPIAIAPGAVAPLRLAGAWRLTAPDPRFGGLSALAIDRGALLAQSDSAVLYRFPRPGAGPATVAIPNFPTAPARLISRLIAIANRSPAIRSGGAGGSGSRPTTSCGSTPEISGTRSAGSTSGGRAGRTTSGSRQCWPSGPD